MIKRLIDLACSSLGLLLLSPIFIFIALAIKIDSKGPVFYRQTRVGQYGKPFRIHKFRSMRIDQPVNAAQVTVEGDPRITRVGRRIRSWKLDELAQLIDVWQGTMSLVGPRPEVPNYVDTYPPLIREKVLSVKPGITDIASIQFRNENALLAGHADPDRVYREEILPRKLALQQSYVDKRSTWLDVKIIISTIAAIFRDKQP
ncbi:MULTISPECIES: sugar transferase [Bordetella]|uniref:Sugar transferase n=1 Tax=Bordetella genomosp. 6 TaxID=463024 RepID=A0ABX4F7X1_9BORD|nr:MULTISPECIES: sugar transferase [Bordetella]AOB24890.1 sugar transferase [Bordetella bronchiseptica]AZW42124.1 sugar transferase [Bordetella bronchiseptica]OZI70442.1 sugar transferase [Bordetella genomosp. 6]